MPAGVSFRYHSNLYVNKLITEREGDRQTETERETDRQTETDREREKMHVREDLKGKKTGGEAKPSQTSVLRAII